MDEVRLIVEFLEQKTRGSFNIVYVVKVTEEGLAGVSVTDSWDFDSWEHLKTVHPKFKSLLTEFFDSCNWAPYENEKELWAEEVIGADGLYDYSELNIHVFSTDL